jgi:D-aspartate ligase
MKTNPITSGITGALVVGGEHPGLGVARSLGRRGIPVVVVDDQYSVSSFSRYVTRYVKVKDLKDPRNAVNAILDVGRKFGLKDWVLYPTRDETVAAVSLHREELSSVFKVTTPDWETTKWVWNKKNTYDLAKQLDIPCPETFNPRSEEELEPLFAKLPLAVKPAVKENFFYATGAKAWRANTPDELRQLFAAARAQIPLDELLVQEIVPGDGTSQYSYCAFFRDGEAHSSLVARRLRQHPYEFGRAATYVESTSSPEIEILSERFLKHINFYGLVEVEYKLDPGDNRYKLLDVNARIWGFHSLGSAAGVDFPYLLFADQTGLTTAGCRGKSDIGWLRLIADIPTAFSQLAHRRDDLRSYLRSLRRTRIESVFCKEDLLPSLAEVALLPYLISRKYF